MSMAVGSGTRDKSSTKNDPDHTAKPKMARHPPAFQIADADLALQNRSGAVQFERFSTQSVRSNSGRVDCRR